MCLLRFYEARVAALLSSPHHAGPNSGLGPSGRKCPVLQVVVRISLKNLNVKEKSKAAAK